MEFSQGHMKKEFDIVEAFKEEGRLKIYNGENHLHQAQNPIEIDVTDLYASLKIG